eukprot:gene19653-26339_t
MSDKPVASKSRGDKTFCLVHPDIPGKSNPPMATSDDRYQAAHKLASKAYRQYFRGENNKDFHIVIKEKLTRETKKKIKMKNITDDDKCFYSVYHVMIDDTTPSSYNKDGKDLRSGFKPLIESRNGQKATPDSQELLAQYVKMA